MTKATQPDQALFVRKLEIVAKLSEAEKSALLALPLSVQSLPQGHDIMADRGHAGRCCLLLDGFMCSYKVLPQDARQIFSFHLPGDVPDLFCLGLKALDHSLETLVPSRVGFIEHQHLFALARDHAGIAAAFWRDTLVDAEIFREWIVNVGQRSIRGRLAHVFSEVNFRAHSLGLAIDGSFSMPLDVANVADATGLSRVDVRRALHDLQGDGLIAVSENAINVLDGARLATVARFDPTYLHVRGPSGP